MSTTSAVFRDHPARALHAKEELSGMSIDHERISVVMSEEAHKPHFPDGQLGRTLANADIKKDNKSEEGVAATGGLGQIVAGHRAMGVPSGHTFLCRSNSLQPIASISLGHFWKNYSAKSFSLKACHEYSVFIESSCECTTERAI